MAELQSFLNFARDIMHEAGRLTLGYFNRSMEVIEKKDGSPVTEADREAELLIRRAIERKFPDHGIYGEEHGIKEARNGCSHTWYIDPIDGTKSFIHGVPLYTCLLGLVREGESAVGVIELPALGQQIAAARGLGCRLNGRRVMVSAVESLENAVLVCSDVRDIQRNAPRPGWTGLWERCRYPRTWGDAFGYAMVATGRAEIMLDAGTAPYDVAPMPVILAEAGGFFLDWKGEENIHGRCGIGVNAALRDQVMRMMNEG